MASAVAIDAEYTMTRPMASSSSDAQASDVSNVTIARDSRGAAASADRRGNVERSVASLGMRGLLCVQGNRSLEAIAALDVVAEHVEARARWRKQHGVARTSLRDGAGHRSLEPGREFHGGAH